jgi:hypothetical protein
MAMGKRLHITSGDATGEMLVEIYGGTDEILCWRDVLHDGRLTLAPFETHARRRARFLADTLVALGDTTLGEDPYPRILAGFEGRDEIVANLGRFEAVTLWFEHDLYDQLQIAEILYRLADMEKPPRNLSMVCIDDHPDVPFFHGLGNLNPSQLTALHPHRQPLDEVQFTAGQRIWRALCAADPLALAALPDEAFDGLPFMSAALRRYCEEYPSRSNGLTRSQFLLLQAVGEPLSDLPLLRHHLEQQGDSGRLPAGETAASRYDQVMAGPLRFGRIFLSLQTLETAPFMGDLWVQKELATLCEAPAPYLSATAGEEGPLHGPKTAYTLTAAGRKALAGHLHWADVNGYDLWRGGVHLCADSLWYWDTAKATFVDKR